MLDPKVTTNVTTNVSKSQFSPPPFFLTTILDRQRQTAQELRLSLGKPLLSEMRDLSGNLIILPLVDNVAERGGDTSIDKGK